VRDLLGAGPFPARNPDQNIADMKAQAAACTKGIQELQALVQAHGRTEVDAYMRYVQDWAETSVRRVIDRLSDGRFELDTDDGAKIAVRLSVDHAARSAYIDFTGTSAQRAGNMNAPRPVTMAAVLYAFRCLVEDDIPLNAGCLRPLSIHVPNGSMLSPHYPAAVAAGNVETSQAICDALFGAMGVLAAAQGTMNNLTFGDDRRQYYETICGGTGAGAGFNGTDAIQSHMTNSRLTDPEILETRFPVRLETFSIRAGSGGPGRFVGGNGAVRALRFLAPMTVGIMSGRRLTAPFGLAGGGAGQPGRTRILRADGRIDTLAACEEAAVGVDDVIEILTPGGGGFGAP